MSGQVSPESRVGPPFDPEKLQAKLAGHLASGGSVVDGDEAVRLLRSQKANALYWAKEGGPGTLVFYPNATRLEVTEEFLHLEQYRLRGWPTSDEQVNPLLMLELELEAQDTLLRIARQEKWSDAEIDRIRANQMIWEGRHAKMKVRLWNLQF